MTATRTLCCVARPMSASERSTWTNATTQSLTTRRSCTAKSASSATTIPLRDKFARLTAQEERFGLLSGDTRDIGNLRGWQQRLVASGVELRGHRVVRRQG